MSSVSGTTTLPTLTIGDGDAAALEGRWSDAVAIWINLHSGGVSPAEARLRWFLANSGIPARPSRTSSQQPWSIILGAAGVGFLGTAIVLVGEDIDGAAAVAASITARACYLAAGVLILMYAYARHIAARHQDQLSERDLNLAIETARELDASAMAAVHSPS